MNYFENTLVRYQEFSAGYELVRIDKIKKYEIPSFEHKKLEEKYGPICANTNLYFVEKSHKRKFNNIDREYFADQEEAKSYFSKTYNDMHNETITKAIMSNNPKELHRIVRLNNWCYNRIISANPYLSEKTLDYLWKHELMSDFNVLQHENTSVKILIDVIENSQIEGFRFLAKENLRKRNLRNDCIFSGNETIDANKTVESNDIKNEEEIHSFHSVNYNDDEA